MRNTILDTLMISTRSSAAGAYVSLEALVVYGLADGGIVGGPGAGRLQVRK